MPPATPGATRSAETRGAESTRRLAEWIRDEPELLVALLHDAPRGAATPALIWDAAKRSLCRTPDNPELLYQAGAAALRVNQTAAAAACLARAIELKPDYCEALILLAQVRETLRDAAGAEELLQKAVAAGADYPDVLTRLALLRLRRGGRDAAREGLTRALRKNPRYEVARAALAALDAPDRESR
jgi:tetratricopeptide (TPR) repeat protein